MAIKIRNNFVKEDILDENGKKIGEINFNPSDSRIISKLSEIMNDLSEAIGKINSIGKISDISGKELKNIEDFENTSETFKKINEVINIEEQVIGNSIDSLSEVFGKKTVELFTGGTYDIISLIPLIEFVSPYVKNARQQKVNKYINKQNDGVMK